MLAVKMIIRNERPTDIAAIRAVEAAAFPTLGEADLVDRLRADGDMVYSLVACDRDTLVGHVLFSKMDAPFRALGLGPVAVLPHLQRRGIGGRLIADGLARATTDGWDGVFVLGDPAYYRRFGFDVAKAARFQSRYAGPHFMALSLQGAELPAQSGTIAYASAFAALD